MSVVPEREIRRVGHDPGVVHHEVPATSRDLDDSSSILLVSPFVDRMDGLWIHNRVVAELLGESFAALPVLHAGRVREVFAARTIDHIR